MQRVRLLDFSIAFRQVHRTYRSSRLDASHTPSLIKIIESLLADRSPLPLGSVAAAFFVVCPTRFDLIHPQFRRLCRLLVDMDEWGQVSVIELLIRYSRVMLPRPTEDEIDSDLKLLLSSVEPLLQSRNPAVSR
jgi:AP-3 complex subunit beta